MSEEELQAIEDERRIDGDAKIRIRRYVLEDVLGILRLSETAEIPRRIATEAREAISKAIAEHDHPAGDDRGELV